MGNRPLPKTLALRDQVLAALRAQDGFPVPTTDVRKLLGSHEESFGGAQTAYCEVCQTGHADPVRRYRPEQQVYVALRALVAQGLVDKVSLPPDNRVYWRAQPQSDDGLEALLNSTTDREGET